MEPHEHLVHVQGQLPPCAYAEFCRDLPHLYERLVALEQRMTMVANNLAEFSSQHQRLHAQMHGLMQEHGILIKQLVNAARGVGGSDWMALADELHKSKKLTVRIMNWLANRGRAVTAIVTGIVAIVTLFQCTPGKSEPLEQPPTHEEKPGP